MKAYSFSNILTMLTYNLQMTYHTIAQLSVQPEVYLTHMVRIHSLYAVQWHIQPNVVYDQNGMYHQRWYTYNQIWRNHIYMAYTTKYGQKDQLRS